MADEIKNAALDSGLIQINNKVFRENGCITIADLVEKYKDTYDTAYKDGTKPVHEYTIFFTGDTDIISVCRRCCLCFRLRSSLPASPKTVRK